MPMFQLRTEVGSLAAAESILHSQMRSGMSKSVRADTENMLASKWCSRCISRS